MAHSVRVLFVRYVVCAFLLTSVAGTTSRVVAQQDTGVVPATDGVGAPSTTAEVENTECVPACREGFLCHQGECISACNPPCEGGLVCAGSGQCVAAAEPAAAAHTAPPPMPAVEPSPVDTPPPPGAWKPSFERRRRASYHFRPYVGLNLTLGGAGSSSYTTSYLADSTLVSDNENYNLGLRPGIEAGFEFRVGRIFGIGPAFRLYSYNYRDIGLIDLLITPTFHIPLGMVEIMIPLNVGATFANDSYDETATGFVFGVTPGVNLWFVPAFGIYAQVGLNLHVLIFDTYASVDYRPMLNTGVTFAF